MSFLIIAARCPLAPNVQGSKGMQERERKHHTKFNPVISVYIGDICEDDHMAHAVAVILCNVT